MRAAAAAVPLFGSLATTSLAGVPLEQLTAHYRMMLLYLLDGAFLPVNMSPFADRASAVEPLQKVLVLDDALLGSLNLLADFTLLKEHRVDRLFNLKKGRVPMGVSTVLTFLVKPTLSVV